MTLYAAANLLITSDPTSQHVQSDGGGAAIVLIVILFVWLFVWRGDDDK